jgi:membrane-anchored mycosin MYCP
MDESVQNRQIVVATDHLRVVGSALDGHLEKGTSTNVRLGLTLLTLHGGLGELGRTLEQQRRTDFPHAEGPTVRSGPDEDLDRILGELRTYSELRHAGWAPTMGKNRTLTGVQFKPYTHDFDVPTVAAAPEHADAPIGRTARVRVGLYDTRIAPHPGLAGRYLADPDALLAPVAAGTRQWWEGHSTFIAGLIRRHAPSAELDVRTALRPGAPDRAYDGETEWTVPLWTFADRLADFRDAGVKAINLSVGVATADGKPPLVLERAVAQLSSDVVVVAAAGNHGTNVLRREQREELRMPARDAALFPAALDNVLAVGALDAGRPAEFNPLGAGGQGVAPWIDVFADGVGLVSTYLGGDAAGEDVLVVHSDGRRETPTFRGWASWSGTSFATGEITGAVAVLLAAGRSPTEAVAEVRAKYAPPAADA